jgi:hypothetical protein
VSRTFDQPVKVVELQTLPAFEVCEVRIGKTVWKTKGEWEGRLVEENVELVAVLKNITEATESVQGVWFLDVLAVTKEAPNAGTVPSSPAAGGPPEGVLPPVVIGDVMSVPPELASQVAAVPAPVMPPPIAPTAGAPVQTGPVRSMATPPGAVVPGMNEIAICLTFEQLRRVVFALKGGIWHPIEGPGIMRPFEDALRSIGG